jgi:hypothetical protein
MIGRSGDAVRGLYHAQGDEEHIFLGCASKPRSTVSWFGSQNQASEGLSVALQNRREEDCVRHASRSSGLLHLEVSRARVS